VVLVTTRRPNTIPTARQHFEEYGPEAVKVTSLVCVNFPRQLFWTEISGGSDGDRCGASSTTSGSQVERLYDTEPRHCNTGSGEQYVLGP
jgi:hypothetical protein